MQARLQSAFDHYIDVEKMSDLEVTQLSRDLEIDIAIDLNGQTAGARPLIFSGRAAPIQVNHIGFPGTMASDYIDYMIVDEFTIDKQPIQKNINRKRTIPKDIENKCLESLYWQ